MEAVESMRLIIANDHDDWITKKADIRAWAQRMLWFAEENDIIITMSAPDIEFSQYVATLKGIDLSKIIFKVLPDGRFDRKMFDHLALMDREFIASVARDAVGTTEVLVSWPSPLVAEFVERIGLADRWLGQAVFSQGASELFNSKANFRAFATAAEVPISRGTVCRTKDEAILATCSLLTTSKAIIVKMALRCAGDGNHILTTNPDLAVGHAGSRYYTVVPDTPDAIAAFWKDQWIWASASNMHPVVVEAFQPNGRTIYAEYDCAKGGVHLGGIGELKFSDRRASSDTVPIVDLAPAVRTALLDESLKLATSYWRLGYRGPLSADAIIGTDGQLIFTEVNAQFTGSTHVYRILHEQIVGEGRQVAQMFAPPEWAIESTGFFIAGLKRSGYIYDVSSRRGVIVVTPKIGAGKTGPIVFAVVYERLDELQVILAALQAEFKIK
jgi:hypothetical protein